MVPDPRDEGKETVFTISGGGDGGVKDQDQDQDQDVASVTKTDKSIGGGHVISKNSFHCKIQYSLYCQAQPLLISAQMSKFHSQSLNTERKGAELTL